MITRRDVFQAIADPSRRAILTLLMAQAMTAGAIAAEFNSTRSTISKHLQILTECGLLSQQERGREVHYELKPENMKAIADWLKPFQQLWENRFSKLDGILKQMNNEE
ncbi:MAG TPA: metalloregulator ArsR/SmtB family transcription factor [Mucilaginibacter sp.]